MKTAIYTDPVALSFDNGAGHPESVARIATLHDLFSEPRFSHWLRPAFSPAQDEQILTAHNPLYLQSLRDRVPQTGHISLDEDTTLSAESLNAAFYAAGAVCQAADDVAAGRVTRAFCAMRPPGHHAEPDKAMGFCTFNNIFIGARHAQLKGGIDRVAIIDFDVHHGNGTDTMARAHDGTIFFISTHQDLLWPYTGVEGENDWAVHNYTLPEGASSTAFRELYENKVLPALNRFAPDLLMISAGFDAHKDDPLGGLRLEVEDFGWVTDKLSEIAARHCNNRIISVLEGGYNLPALKESVAIHLERLGAPPPPKP